MDSVPASEVGVWQLRRVGPPSTIQNSAGLIRLREDGEVTIGRGPAADYFLDSAVTLRLISRVHASIRGDRVSGGHPRFTIINSGLNGTYINDLKMRCHPDNQQVLLEGDRITFGHPGCASIQPGAYAPQHDSEFQFIFECVPASRAAPVDRYCSHSRTVPNGNPRHSHQQKQGTVFTAGNPGSLLTDSPQSNASTSEKENEVGSSLFRDVKNMSSSNGGYTRSLSKHHLSAQESSQPDSKQRGSAKLLHKKAHVLCMDKKVNGNRIVGISHLPAFLAQHGHSNGKISFPITGSNLSSSSPNKNSKTLEAQRGVKNVDLSSSCVPDKLTSVSPAYSGTPSPSRLGTTHDKPCDSLRREIEVHSTMIILGDEVDDCSSDESNDCDNDLLGDPEIEFVTATGPILPTRRNVKAESEGFHMVNPEIEEIDVVNTENEDLDVVIIDNSDNEVGIHDSENIDVGNAENENSCTINGNNDDDDNDVVSDGGDVVNDGDCNMPSLVLMKENGSLDNLEMPDVEEGMPRLMLISDFPQIKTDPSNHTGDHKTATSLCGNIGNKHTDIENIESRIKSKLRTTSSLSEKISNDKTHFSSNSVSSSHGLAKSLIKSPRLEQDNPAKSILLKHKFSDVNNTESGISKRTVQAKPCSETEGKRRTTKLTSGSSDSDSAECDEKSNSKQKSKLLNFDPVLDSRSNHKCALPSVPAIKSQISCSTGDNIHNVSLTLLKSVKDRLSPVSHSPTCNEKPLKSVGISDIMESKSPLSHLSLMPVPALFCPKVIATRCGSPISNTTTIILSSGNELRETSNRSHRKSSGRSNKHKDRHHNQSSPSSSSSRSSSRSSIHSISSDESHPNSRSSSEASHSKSRLSSEASKSRPPSEASKSRPPSEASKSRPPSEASKSRPPSEASKSRPPSEASKSRPASETSKSRPPSEASKSRSPSEASKSRPASETSKSRPPSEALHLKSRPSSEASPTKSRPSSETSKSSSDVPLSKLKKSSDVLISNPRRSLDSAPSSKPTSQSSESSSQNSRPPSGPTDKKFFKDTVPNMYSSSDEECTLQENKTKIVKKIYSSARGKQEKDTGRVEVSRRSALFKGHKISAPGDAPKPLAVPPQPSKQGAATTKPVVSGCDSDKGPAKKDGDSSPASSSLSSDLSDTEGIAGKTLRTAPEIKSEKKTEMKSSAELPPTPLKAKPSVNKRPLLPSSPSLSLTSLPWLTDISVPCKSVKRSRVKQTYIKAGLLPRTLPLTPSKIGSSSLQQANKEGTNLTRSSFAASKVSSPAIKASNGLSAQKTEAQSQKASTPPKSKSSTQSVASSLRDKVEASLTTRTTSKTDINDASKGKDLTSISAKTDTSGAANGLKRSHNNDKPLDSKTGGRNIREKRSYPHRVPGGGSQSRNKNSKLEDQDSDSDEPASKKRALKQSSSEASKTPIRQNPNTRQNYNSLHKQKSDSHSDKTEALNTRQGQAKNDTGLSKPSLAKRKKKQLSVLKKDKPSKAKKKRRKIISDTSSEDDDDDNDDENRSKQDDGDDNDYDVQDMLEDEEDDDEDDDDDSSHSESWELPDGVQYYDNLCSAKKCLNPVGKQVDWVMCDNCEQWYHVVCVDCPIDVVQKEDIQFHCGFC